MGGGEIENVRAFAAGVTVSASGSCGGCGEVESVNTILAANGDAVVTSIVGECVGTSTQVDCAAGESSAASVNAVVASTHSDGGGSCCAAEGEGVVAFVGIDRYSSNCCSICTGVISRGSYKSRRC